MQNFWNFWQAAGRSVQGNLIGLFRSRNHNGNCIIIKYPPQRHLSQINIFGENLNPRGWVGDPVLGNSMLFHTLEIRKGIPIVLPVEALGIKPGEISIALFQDYGIINNKLRNISSIQTIGAEIKIPFLSSNIPILFLSHGVAQTIEGWRVDKEPNYYIQFSLVNPF